MFDVVTDNSAQKEFVGFAAAAVAREKPEGLTAAIARSIYMCINESLPDLSTDTIEYSRTTEIPQ